MMLLFRKSLLQVSETTTSITHMVNQSATITENTQRDMSSQLAETEQVATAMGQMSASIQEIANKTSATSTATIETQEQAIVGHKEMLETMHHIQQLTNDVDNACNIIQEVAKSSEEIGTVVDVIRGVAALPACHPY